MTRALILFVIGVAWVAPAQALTPSREADGSCTMDVLREAVELREFQDGIEKRSEQAAERIKNYPAEERSEMALRTLQTFMDEYFEKLRAFREKFGEVKCSAPMGRYRMDLDFTTAYQALDEYEAAKAPLKECEPELAQDYRKVVEDIQGTMDALGEVVRMGAKNGMTLDEPAKALLRQALSVGSAQIKKFREKHPGDFRCALGGGLADSKKLDRLDKTFQAQMALGLLR